MSEHHSPTRATAEQLKPLAATYAAAFVDDPMIRWPLPPSAGLPECNTMFSILLEPYLELGVVWELAGCVASAAWLDPGTAERFGEIDVAMREFVVPLTDDNGARYGQLWDWLGSHVPDEPCWFLDMLAVTPRHQGRGFGRTLIEHGLSLAQADGLPAFLETSQQGNVGYYESFGFEVVEHERAPDGGPLIWFMRHA